MGYSRKYSTYIFFHIFSYSLCMSLIKGDSIFSDERNTLKSVSKYLIENKLTNSINPYCNNLGADSVYEWNKAVRRPLRVPYTTHTHLSPLLVKGKPFMTQHFSRVSKFVQSFVRSKNTSVVFIGALARYSSSGALGRNYTRCQNSACLEIPDTDLLARSHCIRELLDVRDGVIDIPGLDIDEVLTTINEICCNWFPLCIIYNLF